jgi:hypothetical protein
MANLETYNQSPFNKARKDKFLFVLNLPKCLKDISRKFERTNETVIPDALQFSVYGVTVPEVQVSPLQVRYSGQTMASSSYSREPYPPVTVNFTIDNRFNNYWLIYKWLNILNNADLSIFDAENLIKDNISQKAINAGADYFKYRSDFSLFVLDEYDKRIIEFVYKSSFPTAVGSLEFNNRTSTELETSFTFEYSQLEVNLVEQIDNL